MKKIIFIVVFSIACEQSSNTSCAREEMRDVMHCTWHYEMVPPMPLCETRHEWVCTKDNILVPESWKKKYGKKNLKNMEKNR